MAPKPRPATWTWGETTSPLAVLERQETVTGRPAYRLRLLPNQASLPTCLLPAAGLVPIPAASHTDALERSQHVVEALLAYLDVTARAEDRLMAALATARDGQTDLLEAIPTERTPVQ